VCAAPLPLFGQTPKPTQAAKQTIRATTAKKATKAIPPVNFDAHNEGSVEGAIYGDENLVRVTIDSAGIRYQSKSMEKPVALTWGQVAGWQANNFTSRSPSHTTSGDYGIGIYEGGVYLSFRTKNGLDYVAAIKALRTVASAKERAGIG
jgi:hypothetical protein